MLWLSRRPEWQRCSEVETSTRKTTPGLSDAPHIADNSFGEEDLDPKGGVVPPALEDECNPGKVKTRVVFQPTQGTTHTIHFMGHWLRISRKTNDDGYEVLSVRYAHYPIATHSL